MSGARARFFFPFSDFQIGSGAYKTFCAVDPGVKRPKLEADHSPATSVVIRNDRNSPQRPYILSLIVPTNALSSI
jgi:hypothetical protein